MELRSTRYGQSGSLLCSERGGVEEVGHGIQWTCATRTYGPVDIINLSEGTRSRQAGEGGAGVAGRGGAGRAITGAALTGRGMGPRYGAARYLAPRIDYYSSHYTYSFNLFILYRPSARPAHDRANITSFISSLNINSVDLKHLWK